MVPGSWKGINLWPWIAWANITEAGKCTEKYYNSILSYLHQVAQVPCQSSKPGYGSPQVHVISMSSSHTSLSFHLLPQRGPDTSTVPLEPWSRWTSVVYKWFMNLRYSVTVEECRPRIPVRTNPVSYPSLSSSTCKKTNTPGHQSHSKIKSVKALYPSSRKIFFLI